MKCVESKRKLNFSDMEKKKKKASLRAQPLNLPLLAALLFNILEAIMQTTLPSLPKLHPIRYDANTAPKLWHRNLLLTLKSLLSLIDPTLQLLAALQDTALTTGPRADAGATNARIEIDLALGGRQALDAALDTHLALQLRPPECQGRVGVARDILRLAARGPVRVNHEAPRVQLLQVDVARADAAGWLRCCR